MTRLSKAKIGEVKKLFKEGFRRKEISELSGVSYQVVCYHLPKSHKRRPTVKAKRSVSTGNVNYKDLVFSLIEKGVLKVVEA